MKQQPNEIIEGLANEDAHELAAFLFDELPLSEQAAIEIRAGRDLTSAPAPPQPCPGCGWGGPMTNHNETVAEDQDTIVKDLGLTESESSTIKGGPHSDEDLLIGGQTSYDVKAPRHSKSR